MITLLQGIVEFKAEKFVVIEIAGVGYKVFLGSETLQKIPEKGVSVKIWTHEHIREDMHDLYGFLHYAELEFFEMLLGVSGIGPKGALGVMAVASVDTLKKAIAAEDTSYLTRVSGIGRKTAEKIVIELREKFTGQGLKVNAPELQEEADALEALMSLGYSQREARDALAGVGYHITSAEKRIAEALKKLGQGR
ncbi:MAG: holliday junction DNA helicase RuvA [Parcubacteria group bacterium Gr01-1014_66]|nr:MAG: holliday junction DNA helicase RuvA [Parcubacteria group bacterium Gr01-1014_66]